MNSYLYIMNTVVCFLISTSCLFARFQDPKELPSSKHAEEQGIGKQHSFSKKDAKEVESSDALFNKRATDGFDPNEGEGEDTIGGDRPIPIDENLVLLLCIAALYTLGVWNVRQRKK